MKYSNILNDREDVTTMRPFYGISNKIKSERKFKFKFKIVTKVKMTNFQKSLK